MLGSGSGVGSKIQTSATPKSKDLQNCQIGLRKTIGSETRYLLSFKNTQNRQMCNDIVLTFNEQSHEQRITQAGDSIIIRPDRMYSQKKGLEIDTITISFGAPDLCDRWYAILQRLAHEGGSKTVTKGGKSSKPTITHRDSDEFEVEVERASSSSAVLVSPKKKKQSNAYQSHQSAQQASFQLVNQQQPSPAPLHQSASPSGHFLSLQQSQPIPMQQSSSPFRQSSLDGTVDVNVLVQAIKELQMQNMVLNQRVAALTQDVTYLKSLVPGGNVQAVPTSPMATANPFLTNTNYSPPQQQQVNPNPYAYQSNPATKSVNPFATSTSTF